MILHDFCLLTANHNRGKAYIQIMGQHQILPSLCIILSDNEENLVKEMDEPVELTESPFFNERESLLHTLKKYRVPYEIIKTSQINDEKVIERVTQLRTPYIIYAGFGGQILKQRILSTGKSFLHIHPGYVPDYRGSTTMYYSLLSEGMFGASAIFLEEKIDTGPVLKKKKIEVPHVVPDVDYIYDPFLRASLLVEVLEEYVEFGDFHFEQQNEYDGETYYIIHPVLKHIAILSEIEVKR